MRRAPHSGADLDSALATLLRQAPTPARSTAVDTAARLDPLDAARRPARAALWLIRVYRAAPQPGAGARAAVTCRRAVPMRARRSNGSVCGEAVGWLCVGCCVATLGTAAASILCPIGHERAAVFVSN